MFLGYNTNGFSDHRPEDAIEILAELGYRGIALTIDHLCLSPFDRQTPDQVARLRETLQRYELRSVIETGARFLLDPRHKHEPTLVSPEHSDRQRRVAFLKHAVDMAHQLNSDCVSLWSGGLQDDAHDEAAMDRLAFGLRQVVDHACDKEVCIGFEPEPGMVIATMRDFERLLQWIDVPNLQLTLDVGHLHCQGELPLDEMIRRWGNRTVNVHIEDMRSGIHEHLMFGEGEIQFPAVLQALREVPYTGGIFVELSRHSHMAPTAAQASFQFLRPLIPD